MTSAESLKWNTPSRGAGGLTPWSHLRIGYKCCPPQEGNVSPLAQKSLPIRLSPKRVYHLPKVKERSNCSTAYATALSLLEGAIYLAAAFGAGCAFSTA